MSNILILGASYGLLPGVKLALAGHDVTFLGRAEEIEKLAARDLVVRIPLRNGQGIAELRNASCSFATPENADLRAADFVVIAMQEPHFSDPSAGRVLEQVARSGLPCLSVMNLPPAPFLRRLGIPESAFEGVYSAQEIWDLFDPAKISNASPDPQAMRLNPDRPGELTVSLASNFKAAPFVDAADQTLLSRLARDVSRLKVSVDDKMLSPPVRLLAHSSLHVPLTKWPMLITGNYRCLTDIGTRSIAQAVLSDEAASRDIYNCVCELLRVLGTPDEIMVPFDAYARAAERLIKPSSVARAVGSGAMAVERADRLVANLLRENGLGHPGITRSNQLLDDRIAQNRFG